MKPISDIPPILTVRELGKYLKVHPNTIYRMLKTGQLPAFRVGGVGGDWRFDLAEIERWLLKCEKKPDA